VGGRTTFHFFDIAEVIDQKCAMVTSLAASINSSSLA